jgi:hypothetical protein
MSLGIYPLDTVKRCLQMNGAVGHHDKYKGTIDCMTQIVKQGGPKALYRGVHLFALKEMLVAFT